MRRRVAAVLSASVVAASGFVAAPAHAADAEGCRNSDVNLRAHHRWMDATRDDHAPFNSHTWYVRVNVFYNWCHVVKGPDWVKAWLGTASYNRDGSSMTCDPLLRTFNEMTADPIMHDHDGRTFDPPTITVPCDPSTFNSEADHYPRRTTPRLYTSPGSVPSWEFTVKIHNVSPLFSPSVTLTGLFRNCNGKGARTCPTPGSGGGKKS